MAHNFRRWLFRRREATTHSVNLSKCLHDHAIVDRCGGKARHQLWRCVYSGIVNMKIWQIYSFFSYFEKWTDKSIRHFITYSIQYFSSFKLQEKAAVIRNVKVQAVTSLQEPFVSYIAELWQNLGIQTAYRRRREFKLSDSANLYILIVNKKYFRYALLFSFSLAFLMNLLDYRRRIICRQIKT